MTDQKVTVDDVVIEGFQVTRDFLLSLFQTEDKTAVEGFIPVLITMRFFDDKLMTTIAGPVILRMFDEIGVDITTEDGREAAKPYAEFIATAVQDAYQMVMAQIQQRQKTHAALATGNGHLIGAGG